MINIYLVDDHELVRIGIRRILEDEKSFSVVGEAPDGETAVQWCRSNEVDVILMDMNMPGMGGLEATKKIARYQPHAKIIILTIHCEDPLPTKVMQAGAFGYLTKSASPPEMIKAIRQVAHGLRYLSPEIAQQMALSQVSNLDENPFTSLSERELQITMMITNGDKITEISEKLNLSTKTVNSYRYRLFAKLKINGDVELTRLAIRHKMLDTRQF
ncbi:two-component system response regulator UvrY [Parashewanella spongiae]|uniref:Two-component system response regulator UvrY n=1 Tax=Parashewanella spongiae TaxID=342950 RepID=A0A3A6TSR5_9GAMM|nr:UvrY/SirA/GacA family response regulator transcription factor [Parashewanella spongiae]MCL1076860.1 UvrY/SirA/GacA family response regulator transcription factor [Parashewanella spongiae]RJY19227.1 two-component system response regulator UvrY [Parashewanella spongiae]